jgi:hypothetical protein
MPSCTILTASFPLAAATLQHPLCNICTPADAVQIETYGHREFFTSFLSREDAYRLMISAWRAAR